MEEDMLHKLNQIRVRKSETVVNIDNPSGYRLIGKGKQGAVFQIDEHRCVKVYYREESCQQELRNLMLGGQAGICPKVHFWGSDFIVMDYLTVPSLYDYLQQNAMTRSLAAKIIKLLETFEEVGYNRFDHSARHIFMMPDETMKIIDVVHVIKPTPVYFAQKLISDMGQYAPEFIDYVREISPQWYDLWVSQPDFEQVMTMIKEKSEASNDND
ncbi:hypothetical protein [Paenibacillus qinlingensis]|uniref:Ser/Thr protein kinase n=1 Tax=Paenibacillus qinlingensis TaxID=1837343 RepID=A0ABU1NTL4_9BACL|nr:hypothetical protein [Paenibacillus qinlingensis]MDR6550684.1 putative Ser/Thr protein kinase [Paenibacillus qinlingensis]